MFDSLVYIPAILAYTFVTLLVVILGFIVIYVSHKIYTAIYDNLPVGQLTASSSAITDKLKKSMGQPVAIVSGMASDQMMGRKSKTALRIIVTLEPSYLAFILLFKLDSSSQKIAASSSLAVSYSHAGAGHSSERSLIIYYDNLMAIPTSRQLMRCEDDNIPNSKSKILK